jgi:WXG100 family type VII secretion target
MPAPKIRGDYDLLTQISQIFSRHSTETQRMINRLNQSVSTLQGGDWIGKGANAFYREMEHEVFPSVKRLSAALNIAARTTRQIHQILHNAEDEAARIFNVQELGGLSATLGISPGGGLGQAAGQVAGLLVKDPGSLFSIASLKILIGSQFHGAGLELGILMQGWMQNPSGDGLDEFIQALADIRDRAVGEVQVEFEVFQELQEQRDASAPETPPGGGGGGAPNSFMGSMTQMRYGSVVGDAFGIDPTFGAMLNPTGGLIGPGNWAVAGGESALGYHAVAHDAAGYLYNNHNVGPGYDYLGQEGGDPSSPLTGNRSGIAYWRNALGGSGSSRASASWTSHASVGGINLKSALFD